MLQKPPLLRRIDETSSQFHPGSPDKPLADEPTGFLLFGWQKNDLRKACAAEGASVRLISSLQQKPFAPASDRRDDAQF